MRIRGQRSALRSPNLLCGLLLFAAAALAELTVTLEPVEASRFIYEPFTLLLQASAEAETPVVPSAPGYRVTAIMKGRDAGTFRIEIIPEEAGTLTLPPFAVTSGEETAQTPLQRLTVSTPRPADEMTVRLEPDAASLVVDQPVKLNVTWTSRVPFTRCQELLFGLPLLRNPAWEIYPVDPAVPEKERIGLPVNAQRMIARNTQTEDGYELSFSYWLVPRSEGVFPVEARLSCALQGERRASSQYPSYFDNHFFNTPDKKDRFERIYLTTAGPELTVQALPENGRTVRYSGLVGSGGATAKIEPSDTVVGQPMLLTVTLTDLAFGKHIQNLPESTLDGLGPEFLITRDPMHIETTANTRAFTYIVRPLRSGLSTLPALALDLFDPGRKTYRTVRTEPLPITVEPDGDQTLYTPSQKTEPQIPLTGIRNNRKESESAMYAILETLTAHAWFFWAAPPLLWLALRPWLRRRDRCRTDPAYARAVQALRRFRRNVRLDEDAAWKAYLADRFGLAAGAVTFKAVKPHLNQAAPELVQEIRNRFAGQDTAQYAPPGTPAQRVAEARKLVRKLEKELPIETGHVRRPRRSGQRGDPALPILLLCCLPFLSNDAAPSDDLFEHAMEIRATKPDEAAPLFTEAALEFEAEQRFFNAGNSWFFAGENGRALANFRAAESRRPYDQQIGDSIDFILAQRTGSFQGLEKIDHPVSRVWKRFCTRSPALRFGALTLMSLIGWTAFLTARIGGKAIRRKAWVLYGTFAAVPALSLIWSVFQPARGVVIQSSDARLGPGYAYEAAYENILHEATEFQWLEVRDGWVLARLPDGAEAWLRETACVKIR